MSCESGVAENCTCLKTDCPRHGKCCECVAFHRDVKKNIVFCLRDIQ